MAVITCRGDEGDGVDGLLATGASAGAYGSGTCMHHNL